MTDELTPDSIRWWLLSGKTLTTIMLILLPLIIIVVQFLVDSVGSFQTYGEYNTYKAFFTTVFPLLQFIIFGLIIAMYPPYPAPIESLDKYFKDRGFKTAVNEYESVKRILYFTIPILIFLYLIPFIIPVIYYSFGYSMVEGNNNKINQFPLSPLLNELNQPAFILTRGFLFLIVLAGLLKIAFAISRKKFRLFFAKGCLEISLLKKDEIENMGYIVKGLNSYNLYLRKLLNHEIKDLTKIYSKLAAASLSKKNELVTKIYHSLDNQEGDKNTLKPLVYLSEFLNPGNTAVGISLTEQALTTKIKDWGIFAATIIPVGVMIIELSLRVLGTIH